MSRRGRAAAVAAAGAGLLGASFTAAPGSRGFYALTASTAAVWFAGGLVCGPRRVVRRRRIRPSEVTVPLATGFAAFGVFRAVQPVAERVPVLRGALARVRDYATAGAPGPTLLTTLVNGVAEEAFFRGGFHAVAGRAPVVTTTLAYVLVTTATRNPALVGASAVMGLLLGSQRRATGGVLAPALTHVVWSSLMFRDLLRRADSRAECGHGQ
ncbi:hypothetical protein BAY59_11855 [Prauserella coralliicola]|nr:hypothetical protein BAY59_11855 [Prauserella coralliicola]